MRASTLTTNDLDEARTTLYRHFYSNFVDVLSPAATLRARFAVTPPEAVTIGDMSFGTDVRIRFGELGAYHLDVPLSGRLVWRQGSSPSRVATPAEAAVFQPVGDTTLDHWAGDCRLLAVKIDKSLLEEHLSRLIDGPVHKPITLGPTLDLSGGAGRSWLRLLQMITADAAAVDGRLTDHPAMDAGLRESLVTGLLLTADHEYREVLDNPPRIAAAPRAVRRTVDAMRAQPARQFTVAELAGIAGVSPRALQLAFQRHLGTSPMAYLREVRLGLVHDRLRHAGTGETVAATAYEFGFTHLGRFAAWYRNRYGVTPAETLRR